MAKNRTMQQKNLKAKQLRSKEIRERNMMVMAHEPAPIGSVEYAPYEQTEFISVMAIKCRINMFMGKVYNIIRFQKRYPEIYEYIIAHTVPETRIKFSSELALIRQGLL